MANQFTYYAQNALLNHVFRGVTYSSPAGIYLALFLSDPGPTAAGQEVSGGNYARQAVTFGAPVNGVILNTNQITFPTPNLDWGTVTFLGLFDSLSSGHLIAIAPATPNRVVNIGDVLRFGVANLSVTLT